MEKYRFRSTVYLVFLLISLFVNGLLLYMLIVDESSNKLMEEEAPKVDTSSLLSSAVSTYESAYNYINGENSNFLIESDYISKEYPNSSCKLINFNGFEQFFTNRQITNFMDGLIQDTGIFYDCNDSINNKIFDSLFGSYEQGIRQLTYVSSNEDTLIVTGKLEYNSIISGDRYPLYMVLKKVDNKWLIDSFE